MEVVSTSWSSVITTGTLDKVVDESNVEDCIKKAVQLIHDERYLVAEELLRRIKDFCSSYEGELKAKVFKALAFQQGLLEQCRLRAVEVKAALDITDQSSVNSLRYGWRIARRKGGITTSYQSVDGRDGLRIRVEGQLSGSIFAQLAVLRETQLYHTWFPFCTESRLLGVVDRPKTADGKPGEAGRVDVVTWLHMEMPFLEMDTCFRVYATDCTSERGCVVMAGQSVGEFEVAGVDIPPPREGRGRLQLKEFKARVDVVNPTTSRFNVVVQVDPQLKAIPSFVVNELLKRLVGTFLAALQKQADVVASDSTCAHAEAIRQNPTFYRHWLLPKFDLFFHRRNWETPPVAAFRMEKGGQAGDRGRAALCSSPKATPGDKLLKHKGGVESDLSEFLGGDELKQYQEAYRIWKDKKEKVVEKASTADDKGEFHVKRRYVDGAIDSRGIPALLAFLQCCFVDASRLRWRGVVWIEAAGLLAITTLGILAGWQAAFGGMQKVHHRQIGTFAGTFKKARLTVCATALAALASALLLAAILTTWELATLARVSGPGESAAMHLDDAKKAAVWTARISHRMHVYSCLVHVLSAAAATGAHHFFKGHL